MVPATGARAGVDHLCVQSMDGQLTVYEHESLAFSRFLHNFLLPGPLCYADAMDSFITCNSSFEVESYKYQVLASSSGAEVKMEPGHESELTAQKKMQVDWKFVLGEAALDIRVARFSRLVGGNGQDVLVLSEHMLLALSEMGEIRTQIRLDFIPTALTVYQVRRPSLKAPPHCVDWGSERFAPVIDVSAAACTPTGLSHCHAQRWLPTGDGGGEWRRYSQRHRGELDRLHASLQRRAAGVGSAGGSGAPVLVRRFVRGPAWAGDAAGC